MNPEQLTALIEEMERQAVITRVELWARDRLDLNCVKPCDSYGVCENCNEVRLVTAGASKALSIVEPLQIILTATLKRYRKALEFYAEPSSWYLNGSPKYLNHIVDSDLQEADEPQPGSDQKGTMIGGKLARKALEGGEK